MVDVLLLLTMVMRLVHAVFVNGGLGMVHTNCCTSYQTGRSHAVSGVPAFGLLHLVVNFSSIVITLRYFFLASTFYILFAFNRTTLSLSVSVFLTLDPPHFGARIIILKRN
ncbi:unnamed protein product [Dicrocoelium dendriticum]|nr:unnamed protein product [Dicrocoelium dendriticum]